MEPAAGSLEPILDELIRQAAQGSVVHNDDTGMRILKRAYRCSAAPCGFMPPDAAGLSTCKSAR
jgi:hypothetical protein